MMKNVWWSSGKVPDFNENFIFSTDFRKNTKISNFMKIRPVGTEFLMRTDRRTDIAKLIIPFRNFANAPNNEAVDSIFSFQGQHDL
jgi:hypothetical protein